MYDLIRSFFTHPSTSACNYIIRVIRNFTTLFMFITDKSQAAGLKAALVIRVMVDIASCMFMFLVFTNRQFP